MKELVCERSSKRARACGARDDIVVVAALLLVDVAAAAATVLSLAVSFLVVVVVVVLAVGFVLAPPVNDNIRKIGNSEIRKF